MSNRQLSERNSQNAKLKNLLIFLGAMVFALVSAISLTCILKKQSSRDYAVQPTSPDSPEPSEPQTDEQQDPRVAELEAKIFEILESDYDQARNAEVIKLYIEIDDIEQTASSAAQVSAVAQNYGYTDISKKYNNIYLERNDDYINKEEIILE